MHRVSSTEKDAQASVQSSTASTAKSSRVAQPLITGADLSQHHIGMNKHAQSQQGQNPNFISKSIQLHRTLTRQPGITFKPSLYNNT